MVYSDEFIDFAITAIVVIVSLRWREIFEYYFKKITNNSPGWNLVLSIIFTILIIWVVVLLRNRLKNNSSNLPPDDDDEEVDVAVLNT